MNMANLRGRSATVAGVLMALAFAFVALLAVATARRDLRPSSLTSVSSNTNKNNNDIELTRKHKHGEQKEQDEQDEYGHYADHYRDRYEHYFERYEHYFDRYYDFGGVGEALDAREDISEAENNEEVDNDDELLDLAKAMAASSQAASLMTDSLLGFDFNLGPVLCNTLDCPNFKVLDRYEHSVELRRYEPATFTTTDLSIDRDGAGCLEKAAMVGFHRLLSYNFGDNEEQEKLRMTAPVLYRFDLDHKASSRHQVRFKDEFSESFFVPFKFQDKPPEPSNPDVHLVDTKRTDVFVRAFDGYATGDRMGRVAAAFLRDLYDDGHRFDCRTVYVGQYSPPFQPLFRYNEIWVLRRRKGKRNEAGATDDDTAPDVDPHDDDDDDDDVDDKDMDCGDWLNGDDADDGGMPFVAAAGDGAVAYDVEGDGGVDERKILPS